MVKFQVMEILLEKYRSFGKFTRKDGNFPCKDENFSMIMANTVKFNELYQVTAVTDINISCGKISINARKFGAENFQT
jgi:hypothetical protein